MAAAADPTPGPFALELKRRRLGAQLSMKAAARHCGVGEARWRQVEHGARHNEAGDLRPTQPSEKWVIDVARGLNWDIDDALTLAGYDPGDIVISDEPRIEPPAAMAEDWNKIGDRARKLVKDLVSLLADQQAMTETVEDAGASSTVHQSIPPAGEGHTTRRKRAQKG